MPPLGRHRRTDRSPSSSPDEKYVTIYDDRLVMGKQSSDIFNTMDLSRKDDMVYAIRDTIVGTNPLYDQHFRQQPPTHEQQQQGDQHQTKQPKQVESSSSRGLDWIEMITCLCSSAVVSPSPKKTEPAKSVQVASKNKVIYPIARYPDRLNSPELVEKRRKSLQEHLTFQPVCTE